MSKSDQKIFWQFIICFVLLGLCGAIAEIKADISSFLAPKPLVSARLTYVPQFVLLSFDGSKAVDTWRQTRAFEDQMKASSTPIQFTYFINAAYFLTPDKADVYQAPHEPVGKSNIGFSEDRQNLAERIIEVNKAIADGDEIASHTVGHFQGGDWSKGDWEQEFTSFNTILFGIDKNYPADNMPKLNLKPSDIVGFRAPGLSVGAPLTDALHDFHVAYNSSTPTEKNVWPTRDASGMWNIPLGRINIGPNNSSTIAMDYNIWMLQSDNQNTLVQGTPAWTAAYNDTLTAYMNYFNAAYKGNRAPVLIGHHFETWNDELYWDVMQQFARNVCGLPQVQCTTFKSLVSYMNEYGVPGMASSSPVLNNKMNPIENGDISE